MQSCGAKDTAVVAVSVSFASVLNSCHGQPHATSVEKDAEDDGDADDADDDDLRIESRLV
jgi:hypothetical protein